MWYSGGGDDDSDIDNAEANGSGKMKDILTPLSIRGLL